jgi:3-phenylpropionate/cinnamic acid dioxygenase small subunit
VEARHGLGARDAAAGVGVTDIAETVNERTVEQFLYREARLLDENAYDAWLALWDAEDILYWVPSNADDIDPATHISVIYDERGRLEERIGRLSSRSAWAQDPPSRLSRIVANVELDPEASEPQTIVVHSKFNLTELRRDRLTTHAGRLTHHLRVVGGELRIARKKVILVNNDGYLGNLTFLL